MTTRPFKKESNLQNNFPNQLVQLLGKAILIFILLASAGSLKKGISQERAEPSAHVVEETQKPSAEPQASPDLILLGKASNLIKSKQYLRAIPILEQLVKMYPEDKITKSFLAQAYISQATIFQNQGRSDQSLQMLAKSKPLLENLGVVQPVSTDDTYGQANYERELINVKQYIANEAGSTSEQAISDEKARALLQKAFESYRDKQYQLSKTLVTEAIGYQPNNALAYELLGDSEYFSQNLTAAKNAYQQSFLKDANNRVKAKLEKVVKEMGLEPDFAEYSDEHFIIRYKRSEKFEGSEIREALRGAYREISKDFGHYLNYKTAVILYGKGEYQAIEDMPHWSGALYDGKIRIPIYGNKADSKNLRKFIQHELAHVFIIDISKNQCPVWLHEGLAQYEENKVIPIDMSFLKRAVKKDTLLSFQDLNAGVVNAKDQVQAVLFYHQSFHLASYMIDKYRFLKIKELLRKLSQKIPFDEAFKQTIGIDWQSFYGQWQKEVKSQLA